MRKFVLLILLVSFKSFGQTLEADRLALVAFYQATGGNNWYDNTGWVVPGNPGDNPCGWYGVTCEGGRVTSLVIEDNDIVAPIPAAVGSLTALKRLDLSGPGGEFDYFYGDLPIELGNLSNLEYLDLSGNQLSGVNVSVINNLTNLKHLSLSPYLNWPGLPSFANLINLEYLRLAVEDAAMQGEGSVGAIPAYIGNFTKLKTLIMRHGGVTGIIPSILGNLTDLEVLDLSENQLTGTIPSSFNNLTKLTKLDLSHNNLAGPIPNILGISVTASVNISNNLFNLAGMVDNRTILDVYAPQGTILMDVLQDNIASKSVIKAVHGLPNASANAYKFFREGVEVSGGESDGSFTVNWVTRGKYRIEVRNNLLPALILSTDEVLIEPPLPVTLISFSGKAENNQTKLTWKTASETNNKGFEIERSADARTFEKIGFVDGSGDTKEDQFYHFTDLNPLRIGYYRLKQLDYDGKFEYSKVITVKSGNAMLKIYPNPATDEVTISGVEKGQDLYILNEDGRTVLKAQASDGKPVSVRALKPGLYVIRAGEVTGKLLIGR